MPTSPAHPAATATIIFTSGATPNDRFGTWIATLGPATGQLTAGADGHGRWWEDRRDFHDPTRAWPWALAELAVLLSSAQRRPDGSAARL